MTEINTTRSEALKWWKEQGNYGQFLLTKKYLPITQSHLFVSGLQIEIMYTKENLSTYKSAI